MSDVPLGGVGIGWRSEIAQVVAGLSGLGFCEVIAESIVPAAPPRGVAELRARGVAVVPHGVRLGLGDAEGVDPARVAHLAACAEAVGAPLVSEHVAFVRAGGREAGHLLPVPRTREALAVLVEGVRRTQAALAVPLALEPIAALLDWPEDELTEGDFLTELLERTGASLLLDVANVYANARNRGLDPSAVLDRFPLDRVAYVHMAGGAVHNGLYHDTHLDPVPAEVLTLLAEVRERSAAPAVMLERDGHYPPAAELGAELAAIAETAHLPFGEPHPPRESPHPDARVPPLRRASPTPRPASPTPGRAIPTPAPRQSSTTTRESRRSDRVVPDRAPVPSPAGALAPRAAALVAALVDGAADPLGLDPPRLAATRTALTRKRAADAARHWPLLAAGLGGEWTRFAVEVLTGRPVTSGLQDGWDVALVARARGLLTDGARRELRARERHHRYDGVRPPRARRLRLPW